MGIHQQATKVLKMYEQIKENVERIMGRVEVAANAAGREPSEIQVLAATKYTDRAGVIELVKSGIKLIGENRVQDAAAKLGADEESGQVNIHDEYPDLKVHMIGHLQKNKINMGMELFDLVETVDSIKLADAINKRVSPPGRVLPVLMEVKLTGEETKTGCDISGVGKLAGHIWENCPNLELRGVMGMGPWDPDAETARPYYKNLMEVYECHREQAPDPELFKTISMGMSADFEVAIEEGATLVRIGRALFDYSLIQ